MTDATRRSFLSGCLALSGGFIGALSLKVSGWAAQPTEERALQGLTQSHGLSVYGDLALPPDFTHLPYVNPQAPKGGKLVFQAPSWAFNQNRSTFNTFNGFILKGDAPPRIELLYDSLMARNSDETDSVYGLLAERVITEKPSSPSGGTRLIFKLRPQARFHDETQVRASDVKFSYDTLQKKGHPNITNLLRHVSATHAPQEDVFILELSETAPRTIAPLITTLPVFPEAFYRLQDFEAANLRPPMGSGPYRIGAFKAGSFLEYERFEPYWGKDLPVNRGRHNFDILRMEFFRDEQVAFEAFKKGTVTLREEFSSRIWANDYQFQAVASGKVQRRTFSDDRPSGAQGFFLNMRRTFLQDIRVRQALGLCFDFEWANKQLFFDLYQRTHSFFENSPLKAAGLPTQEELALLEPWRDELDRSVFEEPVLPPVSDGSGQDRTLLRRASRLLDEAGWRPTAKGRMNEKGQLLTLDFLEASPAFERIIEPFRRNLEAIGVMTTFRLVDAAQYQERLKNFDYDITTRRFAFSSTPGAELQQYFSSEAARQSGSQNLSGLSSRAVDDLLVAIANAPTREALTSACRALDRVLRSSYLWIPQWFKASHTLAWWDDYGLPERKARYGFAYESEWWAK
jgi:microcin C transport system substrate-binding protein